MRSRKRPCITPKSHSSATTFAEALSGLEEAPAILDRWRPWLVLTVMFLVLAYAHHLIRLVHNTPLNVPGMRVW
jgi:hypothetical protein